MGRHREVGSIARRYSLVMAGPGRACRRRPFNLHWPAMRPAILHPLFATVSTLAGVGPKLEKAFQRLVGRDPASAARVIDLVFHLPVGVLDRRLRPKLADAPTKTLVMVGIIPERHRPAAKRGSPYRVFCRDETGDITLVFFAAQTQWIERALPVGERRWVSGKIEIFDGMLQMVHPDRIVDAASLAALAPIEPVYPMTEGLGARTLLNAMREALSKVPALQEWQEASWLASRGWPGFGEALSTLHCPDAPHAIEPDVPARCRLAYDELLASQLALLMVRARMKRLGGRSTAGDGRVAQRIEAALPFALTGSQTSALAEIRDDMQAPTRMLRLLQGDVGSGKTVVALLAMATAVEAGRQAAIMAPTEILARQHLSTIAPLAEAAGLRVAALTGRDKGRYRARVLRALREGEIDVLAGTHALFQ